MSRSLAVGLLAGWVADALLGDPRRGHPVAGFGRAAGALERRMWADSRARGIGYVAVVAGGSVALGAAVSRARAGRTVLVAAATWTVLGGTSLAREAAALGAELERDDLAAARDRLPSLCGRDPLGLDAAEIARAGVESVAENTSDAAVAPLFWGALLGVPGLLGYRAVNTLDAMVGHRSPRYARFGWAAARLDDVANLVPARLTAVLTAVAAPLVGGSTRDAVGAAWRDGSHHPSPNSGYCEAAFAGALGLRLGGRNVYGSRIEERPVLGDGKPATAEDLRRSARLSRAVVGLAALAAAGWAWRR